MTRSLGDLVAKSVGVTYEPEIKTFPLTKNEKVVVIGSDGVWDRFDNKEVARIVLPYYEKKDAEGAANFLMRESVERWQRS